MANRRRGGEGHENNDKLLCGRKSALIDIPLEGGFVGCGPAIELQIHYLQYEFHIKHIFLRYHQRNIFIEN